MTAYKQIYKVSTFRTEKREKSVHFVVTCGNSSTSEFCSPLHCHTQEETRCSWKTQLASVLDTGNPKIATRLRYEKNLRWQFVPRSGKTERATTAPVLGDGETQTIRPTFLHKNASNVILFALFFLSLP